MSWNEDQIKALGGSLAEMERAIHKLVVTSERLVPEMLTTLRSIDETLRGLGALPRAAGSAPRASSGNQGGPITTLPNYGKAKGAPIATASLDDLRYYLRGCERTLEDVGKAQFHDRERRVKTAIEAEITRREGAPAQQAVSYDGDDVPF